jgi:hypothetical protein
MPSIDLVRFRFQIVELLDEFSDPVRFKKTFHGILDLYSRRSLKPALSSLPVSLLPTFNCHPQVMKLIISGITPGIHEYPQQAIAIADHLWEDNYLESRELSTTILGLLTEDYAASVEDHILKWAHPEVDKASLDMLLKNAIKTIQSTHPERLEDLVYSFLHFQDPAYHTIGLKMMGNLIRSPGFTRIPSLFKFISPFIVEETDQLIQINTGMVIAALAERTPVETVFFLKQSLALTPGSGIERTIRRYLPSFPEEYQKKLQMALQEHC